MKGPKKRGVRKGINIMRLKGLIRKESYQIVRDPSSIAIAFILPMILLFLFGYGVSLDAKYVPIAVVVEHQSNETSDFLAGFRQSKYFVPVMMTDIQTAEQAMIERKVDGIVWLREDFGKKILNTGDAPIGVFVNGVDANRARIIEGYVQGVWGKWLERASIESGRPLYIPVQVKERIWFNAQMRSRNFLVPGLIAVIMTLIGALLTAMVVAREWERGTMEALMVTPVQVREIILGKIIPYFIMGMGGMTLSVIMATWLFNVPLKGSLWVLFAGSSLFLVTALSMGLLISVVAKSQFVAGQVAIIVTFLPAFILSGFIFDISSMPAIIQTLTHVIAARYFVSMLQTVFLAGDVWTIIVYDGLALMAMALIFLLIVKKRMKKRL
jgi:ABC-2 type transport system permease protein